MCSAVSIGREVAPCIIEGQVCAPGVRARIIDVDFVGGIGRYPAATHHIQFPIEVQPACLTGSSRDRRNRANAVRYRIEAEGIGGVYHSATLVIRCASHVDDATYGRCRRIHDAYWRVCFLCPLSPYSSGGIKLPDLIGGGYVDVESTQDVELVVSYRKPTGQNRSHRTRPIVSGQDRGGIGYRIVGEYARGGCGLSGSRTAHTIDRRRP